MRKSFCQKGRTLVEMISVIILMTIILLAVYALLHTTVDKANAKTLEQEIQARVVQLRHQALTKTGIIVETRAHIMEASGLAIRTLEVDDATFTLRVGSNGTPLDYSLCQRLMKSASFSPENSDACHEDQTYADFIFPKFGGLRKFAGEDGDIISGGESGSEESDCGDHAHKNGNQCVCDEGYENYKKGVGCAESGCFYEGGVNWVGSCISCSDSDIYEVKDVDDCTQCSGREVYRYKYTYNGTEYTDLYCRLKKCPKGYFPDDIGFCYPCNEPYGVEYGQYDEGNNKNAQEAAASCAMCDSTSSPRTFNKDTMTCSKLCTGVNDFVDGAGNCFSCDSEDMAYNTSESECAKCGNLRQMVGNDCAIKNCGSGKIHDYRGYCYPCSSFYWGMENTGFNDCDNCSNTFKGVGGGCYLCSNNSSVESTETDCNRCKGTDTPRKIITDGGKSYCVLSNCPEGFVRNDSTGTCRSCSGVAGISVLECDKCENTFISERGGCYNCSLKRPVKISAQECSRCASVRKMEGEYCVLAECDSNSFLALPYAHSVANDVGWACRSCMEDSVFTTTTDECSKCDGRFMSKYNSYCYHCSTASAVESSETECAKCGDSRQMYGKYCSINCGEGYIRVDGNGACRLCENGTQPNADRTACCSAYAQNVSEVCKCNAGYYGDGQTCTACGDRQYSSVGASSCSTCPAGQTHNSTHTGCQNCTDTTTLGACGCGANEVPDGNGGCTSSFIDPENCSSGYFNDGSRCLHCSTNSLITYASREEGESQCVSPCRNSGYPRHMYENICWPGEEKCPNGNVLGVSKEFCNSCPKAYPYGNGGCYSCTHFESHTFTDRADAENCVRNCLETWEKEIIEKTDESGNTVYECSSLECLRYHYFETQAEAENYKNYCANLGYKMYVMKTPSSYAAVPLGKNT